MPTYEHGYMVITRWQDRTYGLRIQHDYFCLYNNAEAALDVYSGSDCFYDGTIVEYNDTQCGIVRNY